MARTTAAAPEAMEAEDMPKAKPTPAESFAAWWAANIPNSPVSRNTAAYNRAHALRSQMLEVLNSVTGE